MQTQVLAANDPNAINRALEVLNSGGLVAFPTDTVYGLGTYLTNEAGIQKLYEVKARSASKAIAVLVADINQVNQVTSGFTPAAERLAQAFWPGALTLIVPKLDGLPENLSPYPTVGVRIPDHVFARALMRVTGPLATTSANISGENSALNAEEVQEQLDGRIELILDGGMVPGGQSSTVVDCTQDPPTILRQGPISAEAIFNVLQNG